jgi:hypothetical protein
MLLECNYVLLSPLQINILCGLANPSGSDGLTVEYEPFAQKIKGFVENMMTVDVMRRKAQLIQLGSFKPEKEISKYEVSELELFKVFRDYDENRNHFLELWEYKQCLAGSLGLFMTPQEMVTLTLLADVDNNGKIDYQELMKHFGELYEMVKYHAGLQTKVEDMAVKGGASLSGIGGRNSPGGSPRQ